MKMFLREILKYFNQATIGLPATPQRNYEASNTEYSGEPITPILRSKESTMALPPTVIRVALKCRFRRLQTAARKTDKEGNAIEDFTTVRISIENW
jgi:type I site-specific restriction endonuclease